MKRAAILLCLLLTSCTASPSAPPHPLDAAPPSPAILADAAVDAPETAVHPIDAAFEAAHPAPDGSTASMIEYAEAYLDVWSAEAVRIAGERGLAAELAEFEAALAVRAEEELESYRDGDRYSSMAAWAVVQFKAEAYRAWVIANE
ncbi:MAG: hypothetical protein E7632_06045 [Ruminococcaceae bacterium]|nr:hypothetical protein [Oscillospiraceae bacterium]